MRFLLPFAFLILHFDGIAGPARAATTPCDNGIVGVVSDDPALVAKVCRAADYAFAQLKTCDLSIPDRVMITVQDTIHASCLGVFHCGEDRIEVLTPNAMREARGVDGVFSDLPVDRLFRSVIVHELAHAAFDKTPCPVDQCVATSEYFAYAMQLRDLSDEDRAGIEDRAAGKADVGHDAINAFLLFMAPDVFVTNVWVHLNGRPDACNYLKGVQDGIIVFDRFHP